MLTDDVENCTATIANLPTNDDGMKAIASLDSDEDEAAQVVISTHHQENEMCAVFWMEDEGYVWYVGYINEVINNGEKYKVDHLHRIPAAQDKYWQYPGNQDIQPVFPEQVLDVRVQGEWTTEERNRRFVLSNEREIDYVFKNKTQK